MFRCCLLTMDLQTTVNVLFEPLQTIFNTKWKFPAWKLLHKKKMLEVILLKPMPAEMLDVVGCSPRGYQFKVEWDNHTKASSWSDYSRGRFCSSRSVGLMNFGLMYQKSVSCTVWDGCSEVPSSLCWWTYRLWIHSLSSSSCTGVLQMKSNGYRMAPFHSFIWNWSKWHCLYICTIFLTSTATGAPVPAPLGTPVWWHTSVTPVWAPLSTSAMITHQTHHLIAPPPWWHHQCHHLIAPPPWWHHQCHHLTAPLPWWHKHHHQGWYLAQLPLFSYSVQQWSWLFLSGRIPVE